MNMYFFSTGRVHVNQSCLTSQRSLHSLLLGCKVVQANTADERTNFLVEEYSTSGRLDNITQVMSLHTQYLESFLRSQFYMLRMDGPLPLPDRHYIAIMVGAYFPLFPAVMS